MAKKRIGCQTPTQSVVIPYERSKGKEAADLYARTGNKLLEWQQLIVYDIMAVNDEGLWVHQKYGYSVPRRNGKSENVLSRCLWGLQNGERILYTAHRTTTAHSVWERLSRMCGKAGIKIDSSFKAFGKEHLYTADKGIIEFRTRTAWIVGFLAKADCEKVVIDGANGQQLLADAMKEIKLKALLLPTVRQIISANAAFEQGLFRSRICHNNQPSLTQAVSNCEKRAIGYNEGFGYRSIKDGVEVAFLDSVALAYWQCAEGKEKKKQKISY